MIATLTIPFPDFVFVPPKADTEAAAVRSLAAATPHSVVERIASARQPSLGVSSRDLPAASSDVAGLSRGVSIKNATTFAVAAASEIISKSISTTSIPTT